MRLRRVWPALVVPWLCPPGSLPAQVAIAAGEVEIRLGGQLQLQAATTSCHDAPFGPSSPCASEAPPVDWFLRRARFTLDVRLDERFDARLQPDFAEVNAVELKDAWFRITFGPGARLQAGHFKRPFDGFQLTSSTRILTIERDLDVPGVAGLTAASLDEFTTRFALSDRDLGLMLTGHAPGDRLRYRIGVFNGELPGRGRDDDSQKQLVARVSVPLDPGGFPLELAVAAAVTGLGFPAPDGGTDSRTYLDFELWAEAGDFRGGPHLQTGVVFGDNPLQNEAGGSLDPAVGEAFASMHAWQLIASWRVTLGGWAEAVEPLLRVTRAEPNADVRDDHVWGFTPGVQLFLKGRNKLAANWDFVTFGGPSPESANSFKVMYQFHF